MAGIRIVAALLLLAGAAPAFAQDANAGKAVYERKCLLCHGEKGDGKGASAELLVPRPRDFTKGLYKIRSTANKTPSDQDLFRIITDGMPGTSMPSWAVLPDKDRHHLVAYLKTFAPEAFKASKSIRKDSRPILSACAGRAGSDIGRAKMLSLALPRRVQQKS